MAGPSGMPPKILLIESSIFLIFSFTFFHTFLFSLKDSQRRSAVCFLDFEILTFKEAFLK